MKFNNKITSDMSSKYLNIKCFISPAIIGIIAFLLVSCGAHNTDYNQHDGIYSSQNNIIEERDDNTDGGNEKANYYKQYFESKAEVYSNIPEEGAIFTDIDAYSTTERLDEEGNIVIEENYYEEGYGPWGSNAEDLTVNIYNYGGYGYNFYHRPYWYGGYWGYPYYGYYTPYWGINWGISFNWGYPYYGYGYGYPYYYYGAGYYYPHYYSYPYYNYYSDISYNRGRRNTDYSRNDSRGRTNVSTRQSSYSRSEMSRRINRNNVRAYDNSGRSSRSGNIRSNDVRTPRSTPNNIIRSTRSNSTRSGSYNAPTRNNTTRSYNYSTPSRSSSSGSIRSSGSSGRSSSGSVRSSGGSRGRG